MRDEQCKRIDQYNTYRRMPSWLPTGQLIQMLGRLPPSVYNHTSQRHLVVFVRNPYLLVTHVDSHQRRPSYSRPHSRLLSMGGSTPEETLPWPNPNSFPRKRAPTPKTNCLGKIC